MESGKAQLVVKAPAKINLVLKITGKRPDGYHDLFTIMVPVTIYDTLRFRRGGSGIRLVCKGRDVPVDGNNLVWQAGEAFYREIGSEPDVEVTIEKAIPVAAGLGGGSSDAAFTLKALNRLYGNPLSSARLHAMARALGADVPFFLSCRPCVARGIGDLLEPLQKWPEFWYVIVVPPFGISTAWAYGQVKLELTQPLENYIVKVQDSLCSDIVPLLENDFETVVLPSFPQVAEVKDLLLRVGAAGAIMSGSGPSVVGLFRDPEKAKVACLSVKEKAESFIARAYRGEGVGQAQKA